jgi:spoIIIJ-associated protein
MNQNEVIPEIKNLLEETLKRMNVSATVEETELVDSVCFHIKTPDGGILIGENGQHLLALHAIVKRMAERKLGEAYTPFLVDVNDYQRKRIEEIKDRARMSAQRVRYFKKEVIMQPMSAYERRIIHVSLAGDPDVETESIGEGETRRVVIKPVVGSTET